MVIESSTGTFPSSKKRNVITLMLKGENVGGKISTTDYHNYGKQ